MKTRRALTLAAILTGLFALAATSARAADAPDVAVSVKPLHSLVAAVMLGVGEPKLIVGGAASPHTYSLKPSNARDLQNARLIFWLGPSFEQFLTQPLQSLGSGATIVSLEDTPGLMKLPYRQGGAFDRDEDGDAPAVASSSAKDLHFWLDPRNADVMVGAITQALVTADPAHATQYSANAKALEANLIALDLELQTSLAPLQNRPFIVFHDAYQYFEKRYGLHVAGSITVSPETPPGAERVRDIHDKIAKLGATCVFAEPQFEPKLLSVVMEGSSAKAGTLDPEGATLPEGPDLYFTLLRNLARSLTYCLTRP
nr:zinc ABC transporter substrate-binding protein [uncultured Gellertiella sp.]